MTDQPSPLAAALLSLQGDLPGISKRQVARVETAKGGYEYKYAGVGAVMAAVLPRLNRLGLLFIARPILVDGRPVLSCELVHVPSGERLESQYPLAVAANAPAQAMGSAISYGRRYCLTAMIGVVAEDDDDGRAASARYDEGEPRQQREPRPSRARQERSEPEQDDGPRMISSGQTTKLHAMLTAGGHKNRDDKIAYCSSAAGRPLTSTAELTLREAAMIISGLDAALADEHREDPA